MLYERRILLTPTDLMEAIAAHWGPGCVIENFAIANGNYHVFGTRPMIDAEPAKAMWVIEPKEEVVSIYPVLPIQPIHPKEVSDES